MFTQRHRRLSRRLACDRRQATSTPVRVGLAPRNCRAGDSPRLPMQVKIHRRGGDSQLRRRTATRRVVFGMDIRHAYEIQNEILAMASRGWWRIVREAHAAMPIPGQPKYIPQASFSCPLRQPVGYREHLVRLPDPQTDRCACGLDATRRQAVDRHPVHLTRMRMAIALTARALVRIRQCRFADDPNTQAYPAGSLSGKSARRSVRVCGSTASRTRSRASR